MFAGVWGLTTRGDHEAAVEAAVDAIGPGFVTTSRQRIDMPERPRRAAVAPEGADRREGDDGDAVERIQRLARADEGRHTA